MQGFSLLAVATSFIGFSLGLVDFSADAFQVMTFLPAIMTLQQRCSHVVLYRHVSPAS